MTPNKSLLLAAVILLLFVAPLRRFPNGQRNASALPPFLNGKTWERPGNLPPSMPKSPGSRSRNAEH
jgi:hypothetical protein